LLVKDKEFSILMDEATDSTCKKLLAVLVRHCDNKMNAMVDDVLGIVEVVGTTGEELFTALEGTLTLLPKFVYSHEIPV
jgi:hypothetical protein